MFLLKLNSISCEKINIFIIFLFMRAILFFNKIKASVWSYGKDVMCTNNVRQYVEYEKN